MKKKKTLFHRNTFELGLKECRERKIPDRRIHKLRSMKGHDVLSGRGRLEKGR